MSKDRIESKFYSVAPFVELHYLEKGEGKPIVFIPGLTFSGEIFKAQIDYFSSKYRVIAIDPRGQGFSAKPVDGNDYQTHGKDLAALIDGLGLSDVVLVGCVELCGTVWDREAVRCCHNRYVPASSFARSQVVDGGNNGGVV